MCTIGHINIDNFFCIFKNRDNYGASTGKQRFENIEHEGVRMTVFRDEPVKAEGMNEYGVVFVRASLAPPNPLTGYETTLEENFSFLVSQTADELVEKMTSLKTNRGSYIIADANKVYILEVISGKCEIKELTQQSNYVTTNHGRLIPGQQAYEDVSLQRGSRLRLNDALSHIDGVHDEESLQEFLFHGNEEPTKTSELPSAVFNSFTEASFYCLPRSLQTIQWVKEQSENVRFTTMKLS